jgi:hypothetical protein
LRNWIPAEEADMVRIVRLAVTLCAFAINASAQDDPLTWFPLRVGSRWLYEHEWKTGDRRHPTVDRWTTEETITGLVTIPEGLVVLREVKRRNQVPGQRNARVLGLNGKVQEWPPEDNGGYVVTRAREPYLVRADCVYVINNGFDDERKQLRPAYRENLAAGLVSPDFCFSLSLGRRWGNSDIPWRVEPPREDRSALSPPKYAGAIHLFSDHFGSGGLKDVWFEKGVGVVAERYTHNGAYDEYAKTLVSFTP